MQQGSDALQEVEAGQAALQEKERACWAAEQQVASGRLQLEASRCGMLLGPPGLTSCRVH